jgi:hypothetical protein
MKYTVSGFLLVLILAVSAFHLLAANACRRALNQMNEISYAMGTATLSVRRKESRLSYAALVVDMARLEAEKRERLDRVKNLRNKKKRRK